MNFTLNHFLLYLRYGDEGLTLKIDFNSPSKVRQTRH